MEAVKMIESCNKMVLAVISGDDYSATVKHLNEEGFYATILSSTGGFLRKKSITLMIGTSSEKVSRVLSVIEKHAGTRMETTFLTNPSEAGMPAVPISVRTGGSVAFVLDVEKSVKY